MQVKDERLVNSVFLALLQCFVIIMYLSSLTSYWYKVLELACSMEMDLD